MVAKGSSELITWRAALDLTGIWRVRHPNSKMTTGPSNRKRIDFILSSQALSTNAQKDINPCMSGSDHQCPTAKIGTVTTSRGHVYWQMPNWSLLLIEKPIAHMLGSFSIMKDNEKTAFFPTLLQRITRLGKRQNEHQNANANYREIDLKTHGGQRKT